MTYDDLVAQLFADIADLLLGGKKNWPALERLQRALENSTPSVSSTRKVDPSILESMYKLISDPAVKPPYGGTSS